MCVRERAFLSVKTARNAVRFSGFLSGWKVRVLLWGSLCLRGCFVGVRLNSGWAPPNSYSVRMTESVGLALIVNLG